MAEDVKEFPGTGGARWTIPEDRAEAVARALAAGPGAGQGAEVVAEREATHGPFADTARTWHRLTQLVNEDRARSGAHAGDLEPVVAFGLTFALAKIARIVNGDPTHPDHWRDLAGYAEGALGEILASGKGED